MRPTTTGVLLLFLTGGCGGAQASDEPERALAAEDEQGAADEPAKDEQGAADEPAQDEGATDEPSDEASDDEVSQEPTLEPAPETAATTDPSNDDAEAPDGASSDRTPVPGRLLAPGELLIPMEPTAVATAGVYFADAASDAAAPVSSALDFVLGEEYPEVIEVTLSDWLPSVADARLSLTTLELEGNGLEVRLLGEDRFEVTLGDEGDFVVRTSGERVQPEGSSTSFDAEITVRVRSIGAVQLGGCAADGGPALTGLPVTLTWLEVSDRDGVRLSPANATASHPATVTVRASANTELRADDGFGTLIATGEQQFVEVTAESGDVGHFELVGAERVDSMDAWFSLTANWTRGLTLESGTSQQVSFSDPGEIRVAPRLYVDTQPLCADPSTDWFRVESSTPEVCPTTTLSEEPSGTFKLSAGALAAAAGHCELSVSAPTFGTDEVETSLSIEFVDF